MPKIINLDNMPWCRAIFSATVTIEYNSTK